jgi:hypothetical protein
MHPSLLAAMLCLNTPVIKDPPRNKPMLCQVGTSGSYYCKLIKTDAEKQCILKALKGGA